jgi:hypothetical protein
MAEQKPSVGRIVHYVSYGTPGGEYTSQCRAAIVAEAGLVEGDDTMASLVVLNPDGLFFKTVRQDEDGKAGGTWHWPERV